MSYRAIDGLGASARSADIVGRMPQETTNRAVAKADRADPLAAKIQAVASQDKQAFEAIYRETVDRVLRLASRILGDEHAADDVASDTYLQVWRNAASFDPHRGSAIAWILTMARSRALDAMRRSATAISKTKELVDREPDTAVPTHDLLDITGRETSLHIALLELDGMDRQLLALAYFRGYSHQQLADITGQPLGTVKTRIRRALTKLRELMADTERGAGGKK